MEGETAWAHSKRRIWPSLCYLENVSTFYSLKRGLWRFPAPDNIFLTQRQSKKIYTALSGENQRPERIKSPETAAHLDSLLSKINIDQEYVC